MALSDTGVQPTDVMTRSDIEKMLKDNNKQLMLMLRQLKEDARAQDSTTENLDDLDEEVPQVGVQNYGTHVQIMSVDTIPMFTVYVEGRDAASTWLQRFEVTAVSCRWSDDETKRRFKLYVSRPVQDWFNLLRKEQKATWKTTRARFVKEYVLSPIPKEELYSTMEQRTDESDKAYLFLQRCCASHPPRLLLESARAETSYQPICPCPPKQELWHHTLPACLQYNG
ncbi:Aste57867_19213 [Aphanomyces stellatus]|uniref:Aste57867_19213 protein n=1 Tax=Aphanomyces stellatus TaxID=120398 RepID=A0A485LDR1_9STRA|nr:hypothetical protein As57867_019149 [Aphanomyces stellatus]VFT95934.1 Aste57867_19213 [Aphanomyces stellatus]